MVGGRFECNRWLQQAITSDQPHHSITIAKVSGNDGIPPRMHAERVIRRIAAQMMHDTAHAHAELTCGLWCLFSSAPYTSSVLISHPCKSSSCNVRRGMFTMYG
jgi:hypothetical protein